MCVKDTSRQIHGYMSAHVYSCDSERVHETHTQHQDVHQVIDARPFECRLPAVLHQLGVRTWKDSTSR